MNVLDADVGWKSTAHALTMTSSQTKPLNTRARNGRASSCGSLTRTRRLIQVRWTPRASWPRKPVGVASERSACPQEASPVECIRSLQARGPVIKMLSKGRRVGRILARRIVGRFLEASLLAFVLRADESRNLRGLHVADLRDLLELLLGGVEDRLNGPKVFE